LTRRGRHRKRAERDQISQPIRSSSARPCVPAGLPQRAIQGNDEKKGGAGRRQATMQALSSSRFRLTIAIAAGSAGSAT
jgi:hypothetical protein